MHFFIFLSLEADYSGLPVYLTFTGAGPECFYIGITQDSLLEGTEYFYLVLATRDDDIIFDIRSAIVYIVDGNSMLISYICPFSSSAYNYPIYTARKF